MLSIPNTGKKRSFLALQDHGVHNISLNDFGSCDGIGLRKRDAADCIDVDELRAIVFGGELDPLERPDNFAIDNSGRDNLQELRIEADIDAGGGLERDASGDGQLCVARKIFLDGRQHAANAEVVELVDDVVLDRGRADSGNITACFWAKAGVVNLHSVGGGASLDKDALAVEVVQGQVDVKLVLEFNQLLWLLAEPAGVALKEELKAAHEMVIPAQRGSQPKAVNLTFESDNEKLKFSIV